MSTGATLSRALKAGTQPKIQASLRMRPVRVISTVPFLPLKLNILSETSASKAILLLSFRSTHQMAMFYTKP